MRLEDLNVYNLSLDLSNKIWDIVISWDIFAKNNMGKQLVRAIDSVPANISEGFGRYSFKEEKQFLFYARGSLYETKTFCYLAFSRGLMDEALFNEIIKDIDILGKKLNRFIQSAGS